MNFASVPIWGYMFEKKIEKAWSNVESNNEKNKM
jgi:hypothetical protein